ncbi:MAG: hypothetical protein GF350_15105 [Chitinivibrionales bacterium]|nr:hypothetical protein [Chitinivibrionales bacterium]
MRVRVFIFCGILAIALAKSSFSVSGLCVSSYNGSKGNGIDLHYIENDRWVDSTFLAKAGGRLSARFPQFNSYGTHVAFLKSFSDGWWVCVTRVAGKTGLVKKVARVPDDGDRGVGRIWTMILEWPRGPWVWHTSTKYNNHIYRANVETGESQHIADVSRTSNQFIMPGSAKIVIGAYGSDGALFRLPNADSLVDAGGNPVTITNFQGHTGGCGHGIAPSGIHTINNNNGYHSRIAVRTMDTTTWTSQQDASFGNNGNIDNIMWDLWAVDSCLMNQIYRNGSYMDRWQVIGGGNLTLGGWSANSDRWACMYTGWAPEGRDMIDGANVVGINFYEEKTLLLTHNACEWDTVNNPDGHTEIAWNGDFFITSPQEDIAPGYIDDFLVRDSYHIEGTDRETGDFPVTVDLPTHSSGISKDLIIRKAGNLLVGIPAGRSGIVTLADPLGRIVFRAPVQQASPVVIPGSCMNRGVYAVKLTYGNTVRVHKVIW